MKRFFFLVIFIFTFCNSGVAQYFRDQFLGQYVAQYKRIYRLGMYFETTWHIDTFYVVPSATDTNRFRINQLNTGWSNSFATEEFYLLPDSTFKENPDSGYFYNTDSIYFYCPGDFVTYGYWNYYWGKRITTASKINNSSIMIDLFPNPASDIISINIPETYLPIDIAIYDRFGKSCKETITNKTKEIIDISDLPKGMYIVKVKSNSEVFCKKILKE
jgi:hypothetical protein